MQVYVPWGVFAATIAAAMIYLELLPDVFTRKRLGFGRWTDRWLFWPAMLAFVALICWPVYSTGAIDWDRRAPTIFSVMLMTLGAVAIGWLLRLLVLQIVSAKAADLDTDAAAAETVVFMRRLDLAVTGGLLLGVGTIYWLVSYEGQRALCGGYSC